jgi:TetR/AcrR family transcriptional regulator, fatty acid metabolism regulator protein
MTKRQEEILDQAMDLMIQEGIKGLTMKKVADRMKFTEPAMYRHFKDKQDLVVALIGRIRMRYEAVVSKADSYLAPEEYFRALLCPLLEYLEKVRGVTILFLSESTYSHDDVVRKALLAFYSGMIWHVAEYLKEGRKRGLVREDVDEESGAVILVGMIQSLTIRFLLSGGELKIRDKCEDILNIFLRGVMS